ncbi:FkbM family methyltransferase [Wenyingzhuangia sp. IMCC45467]
MKQIIYKLIYHSAINKALRNINKIFSVFLPDNIKIPPSGILTIKNKKSKKLKIRTNQTSYLTHLLFWKGYQNFEYTSIFIKLIKKLDTFYDIGSNIGYYSLLAEMENPKIKVVAFEPANGPLHYLKENIRINNFKNIIVEDIALSEKTGNITFFEIKNKKYTYLKHNLAGESNAGSKTSGRNFVPTEVKTMTFDEYVLNTEQKCIDLVKMDTEGTEHFILKHSDYVLEKIKPIFICETLFNTIESELESIFNKYGYDFYNHSETGLKKVSTIIRNEDNGIRNCFFVHPSRLHLIEEFIK